MPLECEKSTHSSNRSDANGGRRFVVEYVAVGASQLNLAGGSIHSRQGRATIDAFAGGRRLSHSYSGAWYCEMN